MVDLYQRQQYGSGYANNAQSRIKDNLEQARNLLLDEPATNYDIQPDFARGRSQGLPPAYGFARSNYTASEADQSEFETHSQIQNRRRQWGNPIPQTDGIGFSSGVGAIDGGLGALAGATGIGGLTEIGTINVSNSRRGSFKYAGGGDNKSTTSAQKDRIRDSSAHSGGGGGGRFIQGNDNMNTMGSGGGGPISGLGLGGRQSSVYDNQQLNLNNRPQTSDPPRTLGSQHYNMIDEDQYQYGANRSFKDDDNLSQFGQSEFGGMSNIGQDKPQRRNTGLRADLNAQQEKRNVPAPLSTKQVSQNYGSWLQEDSSKAY